MTGHSVQVADVRVGSITGIELTDDFQAKVTMRIKDGLDLPANSVAVLRTTSLLGEKFVELRPPRDDERASPDPTATGRAGRRLTTIVSAAEAPELEFVAEEAVQVLGGVVSNDLATLIETGVGRLRRSGRGARAASSTACRWSAARWPTRPTNIVTIIDGLDRATATLPRGPSASTPCS